MATPLPIDTYQTAEAFADAVNDRLKNASEGDPRRHQDLRRDFSVDRLLARLFVDADAHDDLMLKGANALRSRLGDTRGTKDVDVGVFSGSAQDSTEQRERDRLEQLLDLLERAAGADLSDYCRFAVERVTPVSATRDQLTVNRTATLHHQVGDGTWLRFDVDLSAGPAPHGIAERYPGHVPGLDDLALPRPAAYRRWPTPDTVAEKIHGLQPMDDGRPSTRARDLADLALIAENLTVQAGPVRAGLQRKFTRLGRPPSQLAADPPKGWRDQWPQLAAAIPMLAAREFAEALDLSRRLVDPVLDGTVDDAQSWDPASGTWT